MSEIFTQGDTVFRRRRARPMAPARRSKAQLILLLTFGTSLPVVPSRSKVRYGSVEPPRSGVRPGRSESVQPRRCRRSRRRTGIRPLLPIPGRERMDRHRPIAGHSHRISVAADGSRPLDLGAARPEGWRQRSRRGSACSRAQAHSGCSGTCRSVWSLSQHTDEALTRGDEKCPRSAAGHSRTRYPPAPRR